MAKKLFGRADASLVQAAFAEGRTKGPADYTGIYKAMSENYASTADDLIKEAKETYEAIYKDQIALKEKFSPVYEELQTGNYTDKQRDQYYDIIENYREQFNDLSKIRDKKERKKAEINLNSEFNALQKNLPLIETELVKIATFIANDQHVIGGMDNRFGNTNTENTNFLIGIADFHNKVDDSKFKTERIIEKGKVFYEVDVGTKKVKLDQNQISKLLPVQDHGVKKIWETAHTTGQTSGNTEGVSYDKFSGIFNTTIYEAVAKADSPANAFLTLSRYKGQFNKETFYDALNNPYSSLGNQIKTALENANLPDEFDVGGKKGIDESDFLNKQNFTKIKKYIMDNPLFGAQVMADWATETSGQNAFNYGKNMLNAKEKAKEIEKNKGFSQLNPFGSTANDRIDDGSAEGVYITFGTRNDRRRDIMSIVQGKPGSGNKFVGALGNYFWDNKNKKWKSGDKFYNTLDLMKDEKLYYSGGNFEKGLVQEVVKTDPPKVEDFKDATGRKGSAADIANIIQNVYNIRNKQIQELTGSPGGLKVTSRGKNVVILTIDGQDKEYRFGDAGGFFGGSSYQDDKDALNSALKELLKDVNYLLNPSITNTDYK